MSTVYDYYADHGADFLRCLKAAGASGIARYLTDSLNDPRQLSLEEVQAAHAEGLAVHLVYEMSPTTPGYFTFAQGAADCQQAQARLKDLLAPDGSVVYFAVDAPPSVIPVAVLDAYFNGVESVQTPAIVPGIYGFEAHIEYARTRFPNIGKHTWQTYGAITGPLDLWQHEQRVECGVEVDVNEATVAGWLPSGGGTMTPAEVQALIDASIAAYGQRLQAELDANYATKQHPHTATATGKTITLLPPDITIT